MSLPAPFHPAVSRWWAETFRSPTGEPLPPTPAQEAGWRAIRRGEHTLIAAPTGSGKTLAAFLTALDDLFREGLHGGPLPAEVRVLYVSPLKALGADIHRNLAEPRRGIRTAAETLGLTPVTITAAVRSGDTPQAERAAMLRTPPHILVTTPESLYLLLTAAKSRAMLRTVRTVIVDEIHAVLESRRGAHLALSLERLDHIATGPVQRIGLSATQRPIEDVARFLVGASRVDASGRAGCAVIDEGHRRELDLGLELTGSPLEAVMAAEAWGEVYDRVADLVRAHGTTLVFVNTRRLAERVTRHLAERLGEHAVTAHHGSLSREARHSAEQRLKEGRLRALVATASLELGIDVGAVDLVVQLGSPRRIATFLQRVGRSGHTVFGTPKGRLFPLTRDELVECAALLRAVRQGELDRLIMPPSPVDVLAQQIVAEAACEDWDEAGLFELVRRAWPYRELGRTEFDEVVTMLARGFATRRGRRAALVHHDGVNGRIRGRRGSRLLALTSGGAIPEVADYRVVAEPAGTFIGTVNEDFAVESMAGDIFQLGNASWLVLRIEAGVVRVADAHGQPPGIPFWLGEAPARSRELSAGVSALREEIERRLGSGGSDAAAWLLEEAGLDAAAAEQIVAYLAETRRLLGVVPSQRALVLERFFDDSGGMQLVLHAPFGARVTRAWGLALRKKFCRRFNFELQAAATEEGLLLSLGPQHSFPLEEVWDYLSAATLRETLVQAVLDSPIFTTRWRWAANLSLAVPRSRGGVRVPPPIQRMQAEDLLAAVFPDAAACFENIGGDREVPDHPLIRQVIHDCLEEAMSLSELEWIIENVRARRVTLVERDTPEPSPLAAQILNARVYEFLDDAPLEERRAQAVYTRRATEPSSVDDLGALDTDAIARVRDEAWPRAGNADELHDALMLAGYLTEAELPSVAASDLPAALLAGRRAVRIAAPAGATLIVAAERAVEVAAAIGVPTPASAAPAAGSVAVDGEAAAVVELLRGRLEVLGPVTAAELAAPAGLGTAAVDAGLVALEAEGTAMRGFFTPGRGEREWCDRRLLARIHRYTLNRLRAEIEPVNGSDFMRFLFRWQRIEPGHRAAGADGLAAVLEQLDGFEAAAAAWEADLLPARVERYEPGLLDSLCLSGRIAWGRLSVAARAGGPSGSRPLRSSPIAVFDRASAADWLALACPADAGDGDPPADPVQRLSTPAREALAALDRLGASFFGELVAEAGMLPTQLEQALAELAAAGLVTSDSFAGLRALLVPASRRPPLGGARRRRSGQAIWGVETAGRWGRLGSRQPARRSAAAPPAATRGEAVDRFARALLRRYGVVFRRLLAREPLAPAWRELALVYRRLEARGELRGGRFVAGVTGEQFALPDGVAMLRSVRREPAGGRLVSLSAADPLNLVGVTLPGERVPAVARNRVLFLDGAAIAARVAGELRVLGDGAGMPALELERALARKGVPPSLRSYLRTAG
jgi:ATP-dependent helicase Lhr and Lhr-like helicase